MEIKSKLPAVGTTIFTVMSQLAAKHGALNLSQGFPDFSPPDALVSKVHEQMLAGNNQYAMMTGVPVLREAIATKVSNLYGASVDVDAEITVTSGATDALFTAIAAVVQAGDEVIVFDPAYDSYEPAITLAGGVTIHIPLQSPGFFVDWDQVKARITSKTRLIVLNTPHNPTGSVFQASDLDALAEMVADTQILILSDEVYEHIIFDGRKHLSMLTRPELRERSFVVSSFGKTYHMTGWKLAYCVAPPDLSVEFRKVHQYVTFCTSAPMQYAIAEFMNESTHHLELADFYQSKRDHFAAAVSGSRFQVLPCHGTYFQLLDYSALTDEADEAYARRLTIESGIASIPISPFCAEPRVDRVLRFCFAKDEATLDQAAEVLRSI